MDCAEKVLIDTLNNDVKSFLSQERFKDIGENYVYVNTGCPHCYDGNRKGALQPYAEVLIFTEEIKYRLRTCDYAYEMETLIKEIMENRKTSLDYKLVKAVKSGELNYKALYSVM